MPWGWINDMQIFHIKGIHVLLFCALYSSPRHWTVGAPPALPTRKPGLTSAPPWPRYLLSLVWACPRPERFPIPYLHVMNNNTQGRILHYSKFLVTLIPVRKQAMLRSHHSGSLGNITMTLSPLWTSPASSKTLAVLSEKNKTYTVEW